MTDEVGLGETAAPRTTAIKAGWICFCLGAVTFWIFGIGMIFFSAAFVFGIVAMATHEVRRGLALFSCSIVAILLIPLSMMFLGVGALGYAATKAQQAIKSSRSSLKSLPAQATPVVKRSAPAINDSPTSEAAVESFLRQAKLSAVITGNPAIAVINGKDYEVGQELITPSGARLRVTAIIGNEVHLRWDNRGFAIALP